MSNDVFNAVLNRLAGWSDGSLSLVRNNLTTIYMKCHPEFEIGQITGLASTEFGLAGMILSGVNVGMVRDFGHRLT